MSDIESVLTASPSGVTLSLRQVLQHLKRRGQLWHLLLGCLADELLLHECGQARLTASTEELQQAANRFRHRQGLTTAEQTNQWLAREGLTVDDFEAGLERELLVEKFKDHLVAQQAAGHFAGNRERYGRAQLRQVIVASDGVARELLARINDEGCDFADLAREHSLDNAGRQTGGSIGVVPRHALPVAMGDAVFAAKIGAVVGPFATQQGVHLLLVEALHEPVLDAETAAAIRGELFDRWLTEQMKAVRIDLSSLGTSP